MLPRAAELLDCPKEGRGSDVLGALRYAVKQLGARLLPDLSGYAVVVHGFVRAKKSDPDRFSLLESFWRAAFEAAGTSSVDLL
ncbi:hypothetical protein ACIBK9_21725 [Nonomuraea sp. NPDC050227]|uniref:hypothetical protein n=1 Tax=Nonomuraea sp. NPDC050227 TaxID=3364360 RepID=UPI0037B45434